MRTFHNFRFLVWILIAIFVGSGISSADHELGHYEFTLEEDYYDFLPLIYENNEGVSISITSSQEIDVILLTPENFEDCCSGSTLVTYGDSFEKGTKLNVKDYSYRLENGEGPRYLIFDHTSEPFNGATPSGDVQIELVLLELEENAFSFQWQNLLFGIIIISVSILFICEALLPNFTKEILNSKFSKEISEIIEFTRAPFTILFIAFNSILFFLRMIFDGNVNDPVVWMEWGAMASGSVQKGNILLIITSNFFHFDFQHLVGNMFSLYIVGRYLEPKYGVIRFSGILIFGGLLASIFSMFYDPLIISGGASGMVFCTFGVVLMEYILDIIHKSRYKYCQWHDMQWFWGTILVGAFVSFVPGVSLLGHAGGLVGGMVIVYLMTLIGTHPGPRDDQLINCQSCGFQFPVADISNQEISSCPGCGTNLSFETYDERFPGWPKETIDAFKDAGWTEEQLVVYYTEQLNIALFGTNDNPEGNDQSE